jgi:hypothetical protein
MRRTFAAGYGSVFADYSLDAIHYSSAVVLDGLVVECRRGSRLRVRPLTNHHNTVQK